MSKATLEKLLTCNTCYNRVSVCDWCNKILKADMEIFHSGNYHTCSRECMERLQDSVHWHGEIV